MRGKPKVVTKEELLSQPPESIKVWEIECKCGFVTRYHELSIGLRCSGCGYNLEYKN